MDMVVPRDDDRSFILRDCHIKTCDISMNNQMAPINTALGGPARQVVVGSSIDVVLELVAGEMETINEPYEIAAVREKRVRDCSLGELILAIAGKA